VDTRAVQGLHTFDVQDSVRYARSDNHGFSQYTVAFGGSHPKQSVFVPLQRGDRARNVKVGSELESLKVDQMGEVPAGDATRETRVILNPGS
jgi:hypothetical protein